MSTLAVTLLTALATWAADWEVNINPVALHPGDTVYIKNVATGKYLGMGEAWGSQAVVSPLSTAGKCVIIQLEDGTYQIKNDLKGWETSAKKANILYRNPKDATMGVGVKGCFVDYSTSWNEVASKWAIATVGNNVYTFQVPNLKDYQLTGESTHADSLLGYVAGEFLGVNRSHASSAKGEGITWGLYYDVAYADSAANCQFQFIPAAQADTKAKLLKVVEQASGAGIDVSAAAAMLADANADVAAMKAEAERLSDAIENAASVENPQDLTSKYISNPTPLTGNGTPAGWTVLNKAGEASTTGSASDGVCEFWNAGGSTLKYTINQLPAGVYRFTAVALTRRGMHSNFFVGSDTIDIDTVSSSTVNSRSQAATWFTEDRDNDGVLNGHNTIELVLTEAMDVTLGLVADSGSVGADVGDGWTVWREFKIESLGTSLETFQYVNGTLLGQFDALVSDEETKYTTSIYEAGKQFATEGKDATSRDEAANKYVLAKAKLNELKANIAAWAKLEKVAYDAEAASWQLNNGEAVQMLVEQADEMMYALTASTAEVLAMIDNINKTLDDCRKQSYVAGDDVTNLIVNPTFNDETVEPSKTQPQSKEGWTGANFGTGGNADSRLCEVWAKDFDTYQDIKGMQPGAYELSIQAYMRPGYAADSWTNYKAGQTEVPAWIYIGKTEKRMHNICDFTWSAAQDEQESWETLEEGKVVPNTMATTFTVMDADANTYKNTVVGLVTEQGGTMRIGIKAQDPNQTAGRWIVFHDFSMRYLGNDAQYIKPVLDEKIAQMKTITDPMSANEKALLDAAMTTAETASAGSDGTAMLKAYAGLAGVEDTVKVSIAAYAALQASLDSLKGESQTGADAGAIETANKLISEVTEAISTGSIAILDVPAKQAELAKARKGLMIKDGSDDAPSDYTAWIANPTFNNGFTGWTVKKIEGNNPTATDNTAEIWSASGDVYQDITGLPEGTYQVKVKGFFRQVGANRAWLQLLGDSIEDLSRAKIYANMDFVTPNEWATRKYKDQFSATGTGWYEAIDSTTTDSVRYFLPNTRANARVMFDADAYQMEFFTYVNETGVLRIGFGDDTYTASDWFVTSDWELYYYGKNSKNAEKTGITEIGKDEKVNYNEVYSVDGRQLSTLQKGANILRGKTVEGKIVTKKVVVK